MRARRFLARPLVAAALLLAAVIPSRAFLFHGAGSLSGGGGAVVATRTIINTTGATLPSIPHQFGQVFARGDVPGCLTANTIQVEDHLGNPLTTQIDEANFWDDGSCRQADFTIDTPTIAAGATEQLQFVKVAGSYTPGTDNRTTADITGSHDFQVRLTAILDHANAIVGSGAATFDANTCIGDGTIETYATGPVRHGVMVACAGLDTAPTTTTLSGSITSGSTSLTVASATGFPTSGNYLVKIDHEYLIITGGQGTTTWTVTRGAARSTAASHSSAATVTYVGNFYAFLYFDIYTDPTNPAVVYSIGHIPLVMQPWLTITNADFTSYRADYTDVGHGDVRNWAGSATIAQNATNISTSAGTISIPTLSDGDTLQRSECVDFSSTGTLPTTSPQIVAGQPYWVGWTGTGTTYDIYPDMGGAAASAGSLPRLSISAVGSGNLTITRRICHPYREAWFSTADDAGHENYTANAAQMTALYPALTTSEKQYWEKAGLIPPYDTGTTPNALPVVNAHAGTGSSPDSTSYRPLIAVSEWDSFGAAGGPPGAAPLPTWDVVAFLRQDQSDWDIARAGDLGKAAMPWVATLQEATGHIQPFNGGASRFNAACVDSGMGTNYTVLGAAQKDWIYGGLGQNGVVVPASGAPPTTFLTGGVWARTGGDGMNPSQGHWPLSPYMAYLFFGREWMLDLMYMDGNNTLMIRNVPLLYSFIAKNKQIQINGTGSVYTAQYPFGNDRQSHSLGDMVMLSAFGSSSLHQERAYGADVLQENICGMAAVLANQSTGQDTLGMWDLDTSGEDGLTTVWGSWGWIWAKIITRNSGFDALVNRFAANMTTRWGEQPGGWSSFYGSVEYLANFEQPQTALISSTSYKGSWQTSFATSISQVGFVSPSGSGGSLYSVTAGTPGVFTMTLSTDFHLSNGDKFKCMGSTYVGSISPGSTYTGPPECEPNNNPNGNLEWFYVCNETGTGGTVSVNIGTSPPNADGSCNGAVAIAASQTGQAYAIHPTAAPPVSDCVLLSVGCTTWDAKGQYAYYLSTINWLTSEGALSNSSSAYLNANARVQMPLSAWQGNPTYDIVYQPIQ